MCTSFKHRPAADGSVVVGRTMEFPAGLPWQLQVLPKGHTFSSMMPGGRSWTSTYGIVGFSAVVETAVMDGMNEAGVSGHGLYMTGFCHYAEPRHDGNDLCEGDVIPLLLGTCSSIAELKAAAAGMNICGFDPGVGFVPPVHFVFHDKVSSCILEMRPEGLSIVDNPVGVATNAPFLDWHLTNLRNYTGITASNPTTTIDGFALHPLGNGGGLRGLPGDYTPPGRFVRAVAQVSLAADVADGPAAERSTLHILNTFDINAGLIRETGPDGKPVSEVTEWSTVSNLTGGRYAYRTINDPTVYVIDLATTDFSSARSKPMPDTLTGSFVPATL